MHSHSAEYEDKHSSTHYREGGGGGQQPRTRHRLPSDYPPPGDLEEEGGRRGPSSSGGAPGVASRKPQRESTDGERCFVHCVGCPVIALLYDFGCATLNSVLN